MVGTLTISMVQGRHFASVAVDDQHRQAEENLGRRFEALTLITERGGDGKGSARRSHVPTLTKVERFLARQQPGLNPAACPLGLPACSPIWGCGAARPASHRFFEPEDGDASRSADLRRFAESRPDAPTVGVWYSSDTQSPDTKGPFLSGATELLGVPVRTTRPSRRLGSG